NWQQDDWSNFSYDKKKLTSLENDYTKESGICIGVMRHLSKEDLDEFRIEIICNEALKTSEIEGEFLDRDSLQSSICKEFGVGEKYLHGNIKPEEAGIAMMMKDLYTDFNSPLTNETLLAWHDKLLNGKTDLERGKYRTSEDDMRVVSGRIDKPKIHFIAPPASEIPREMDQFISWFNRTAPGGKAPLSPLIRAGITHLYFVTIHPFEDGNGRIGRALTEKALSQSLGKPTLIALSSTISDKKKEYYKTLELQNKNNQITPWLYFFGKTIIEAQKLTIRLVDFVIAKAKFFNAYETLLNPRQKKAVLRIFREGPKGFSGGFSAKKYMSIVKIPSATATRDLRDLVDKGIFTKTGKLKSTRYVLNFEPFYPTISLGVAGEK
ncbi:MAG: Fic family protein, partial [Proteobacteria bacterium]|nr:Fic family protein [Pseudomonadota bacterium]